MALFKFVLGLLWACVSGLASAGGSEDRATAGRVLRVVSDTGRSGSGVPVAANKVATACHTLAGSAQVSLLSPDGTLLGKVSKAQARPDKDVCVLLTEDFVFSPDSVVPLGAGLRPGEEVTAIGYTGGTLSLSKGRYEGLEDGLLRHSAPCDKGSSGGGLFDKGGRLAGVLVLVKDVNGIRTAHYASPADAIREAFLSAPTLLSSLAGMRIRPPP